MRMRKVLAVAGAILLGAASAAPAQAPYPNRLVRLVVTVSAGSVADGLARILAEKLGDKWHQQVIVENRLGISGIISAANATPDGYTLMVNAANTPVIAKVLNKEAAFDPLKDFVGVTKLASAPLVAVVSPSVPAKTLAEFVALARQQPGKLNFSSSGISSINYLCFELFRRATEIDVVHIPYKGAPEAITAVIRNDTQVTLTPLSQARQMAAADKVRPIAINDTKRSPQMPDVQTIAETVPGYKCDLWFAIVAPAGVPRAIIKKLNEDIAVVFSQPDVAEKLKVYGAVPSLTTPEQLDEQIKEEAQVYTRILRDSGGAAK